MKKIQITFDCPDEETYLQVLGISKSFKEQLSGFAEVNIKEHESPADGEYDEFTKKHLDKIWELTKDAAIERHIKPMFGSLDAASIEHFLKTQTVNGGFKRALHDMMNQVRRWHKAASESPADGEAVAAAAVRISEIVKPQMTEQEQAVFIAGFCECIKWLSSGNLQSITAPEGV